MRTSYFALLLAGITSLSGCGLFGGQPDAGYPGAPPIVKAAATAPSASAMASPAIVPTLLKVPVDAIELSSGPYPPPSFPAPTRAGQIDVVDLDGDPTVVVASTLVTGTGGDAPKQMSITDVTNMSVNLDKSHKYKIVFVPLKAGTSAP